MFKQKGRILLPLKVHSAHISQGRHGDICKKRKSIRCLTPNETFEGSVTLTAGDLCSCRFCHLVWPNTDQFRLPGPGVPRLNEGSQRMKTRRRRRMRLMVLMKMSVGWSCPSPPQRKKILKGKEIACRHAYTHTNRTQ